MKVDKREWEFTENTGTKKQKHPTGASKHNI